MTILSHNPPGLFPPYRSYSHATEIRGDSPRTGGSPGRYSTSEVEGRLLERFQQLYPKVTLDISLHDGFVDLVAE
jgi:hypothetical protein